MIFRTLPIRGIQIMRAYRFLIAVCLLFGAAATMATAETIDYTDLDLRGQDVEFLGVTEDSITDGLPLFDEPTLVGNSLVFNPASFEAFSDGGGVDLTDASMTMEIRATNELGMSAIEFFEAGEYLLSGIGTNATFAQVGAPVFVQIIEVDGQSIDPILIVDALEFTPSGGDFKLQDDQIGARIGWEGTLTVDLDAALAANNIDGATTRVLLNMDNSLLAESEAGSQASLKKNETRVRIIPIPEPSSIVLAGFGLFALVGVSCRRRRER
jgi:hypothetical protein